ncbi:MAG: hypothetical protein Ta2A_06960 [Treponemataceae bacterium]|nr:MAG: hypothetical protein Ta2A_06960 [Treponemataceae bacterium]
MNKLEHNLEQKNITLIWSVTFFSLFFALLCIVIMFFVPENTLASSDIQVTEEAFSIPPDDEDDVDAEYSAQFQNYVDEYRNRSDASTELYASINSRSAVEWFYAHIVGDKQLSSIILHAAEKYNISLTLAFSIAYNESHYKTTAQRTNPNGTIDRGLFQLNSRSFPTMNESEFFDPAKNAEQAMKFFRYCLNTAGNEITALAIYNAGAGRVETGGTPSMTLAYISHVISYRKTLDDLFYQEVAMFYEEY